MLENMLVLNKILATAILFIEIVLLLRILIIFFYKGKEFKILGINMQIFYTEKILMKRIFFSSLAASILTLVYSEIFGQVPCSLCWFGRIALYAIVILSGASIFRKEEKQVFPYVYGFSFLGALVSLYHHFLQITPGSLPCPKSGGDCAQRILFEYGHITFPWMAFIIFATIMVQILLKNKFSKNR